MLESMRNAAQGIVGKAIMTVVMGLIIVSFVIWGVGDMLRGFTSSTVASVGSQKISAQDYHFAYERLLQQYQRRLRQPFTNEQARAVGLDREVLQRLLSEAAIDEEARKLGLNVSEEALRAMIVSNPSFRDKSGAFDPQKFAGVLRDNDMNERMFVSDLRKTALRQFIVAALTTGIAAPKAEATAEADFQGQTRSIDYFILPASAAGEIAQPSEETLKSYFDDRKSQYRAPEYRAMDIVSLEPETLANPDEISDADAQAAYDQVAGKDPRYGSPEKRDLQQILFPNDAEAEAAEARIKAGASFEDIVKERNLQPDETDIGETTKDGIIDKAEADAVFALPQGGVSGVLKSQFGPVIVRVKSITPSTVKPYAEVAQEIKRQVSASRAGDKIQAIHDKIEDARVSGKSLAEVAKDAGLTAQAIPAVDAQGLDPKGAPVNLPDKTDLLRAAFASDVGLDEAPLQTKDNGFVWFSISKIEPSHDRSFDDAKAEVEAQWRADEIAKALAAKADDLVKQLRSGGTVADVAKSAGAEAKTAADIHRDDKTLPEAVVAAIFREPADGEGSAASPDGRAVFKITADKTPPVDFADLRVKEMAQQLDASTRDSLLDQYVEALRRSLGVVVHPEVLQSAEGG
ncbi:MAG: SurA N-terminal domain-containing protein [Hyphomicrobiales bacterium]|nr:SurA N-terminal domain-containing protein [Hyphomicrobiales bacterium]